MWEKIDEMFPCGFIPGTNLTVQDIVSQNLPSVTTYMNKVARNMVIQTTIITWFADGTVAINRPYDVQLTSLPEESCLSVFGNKMVMDWRQRDQFAHLQSPQNNEVDIKEIADAGFNYTGLQE